MPQKVWKWFPFFATILTLQSTMAGAFFVASKGSSEAHLLNAGVVGHTYTIASSATIDTTYDCGEIIAELNRQLIDKELFESRFVYDYVFACIPAENDQSYIVVDLTVEPATDQAIEALEQYRDSRQGQLIHKQLIDFRRVAKIQIEKSFTAEYFDPLTEEPIYSHSVTSKRRIEVPNFAQYRNHMALESRIFFQSPTGKPVLKYLADFLDPTEMRDFKKRGLSKANHLSTVNARKILLSNDVEIRGIHTDGAFRECRSSKGKFCLAP